MLADRKHCTVQYPGLYCTRYCTKHTALTFLVPDSGLRSQKRFWRLGDGQGSVGYLLGYLGGD